MGNQLSQAFIFMRVGNHAGEDFDSILKRKQQEFNDAGMIFWGYGGTTLHPVRQVQPFAKMWVEQRGSIQLVMQPIDSKADPDILPATEYSIDGIVWEQIPRGIAVTGSRYAIVLDEIEPGNLDLNLRDFEVGIGPSRGRNAAQYLKGRVDKGCFVASKSTDEEIGSSRPIVSIGFQAKLLEPYAVMLRHRNQQ